MQLPVSWAVSFTQNLQVSALFSFKNLSSNYVLTAGQSSFHSGTPFLLFVFAITVFSCLYLLAFFEIPKTKCALLTLGSKKKMISLSFRKRDLPPVGMPALEATNYLYPLTQRIRVTWRELVALSLGM